MELCDKLTEENIHCDILLSNGNESVQLHWNGEDFAGECNITDTNLLEAFTGDENIIEHLKVLFEIGAFECDSYRMEIL